ncbi:LPS translocon maturation chaperone LptM [Pseudomaricurvus sp.]|uniref:LPS translocon maturation chaperone LptM n=1 Tax=Pseudomaricurvus sp. TaxID=2004510 RepID=UPI003F6B48B7
MRLFSLILATALLTFGLAGCGQKGPLYLPQPEAAEQQAAPEQPAEPAASATPTE